MGNESSSEFDTEFFNKYATPGYLSSKGAFGTVYGPIRKKGKHLAIKQVMLSDGKTAEDINKDIKEKQQIWNSLEHENLMRFISVNLSHLPKVLHIVMEFASGGSLHKILRSLESEHNKLPIDVVTNWTKQIANGMLYLHQKNIVHRDLKPSNILLLEPFDTCNPRKTMTLKITDFDDVKTSDHTTTMSFVGTIKYMAPEVLQKQRFSKASDVWSFGVLTWEMLSGDIPHKGLNASEIMYKSLKGELDGLFIVPSLPGDYKFILKQCWKSTLEERSSFQEIHDFLHGIGEQIGTYRSATCTVLVETIIPTFTHTSLRNTSDDSGFCVAPKQNGDICVRTYSIAMLDKELFVVSVYSSNVDVYDSIKFGCNRQMNIMKLYKPLDMVSCTKNRCIYILHYKGGLTGILKVDSNGKLLMKWSIGGDVGISMSVTGKGNIIVTVIFLNKLSEYSSDGELIREIDLSKDTGIRYQSCAIQLNNGHFAISHVNGYLGDDLHRVCIVDADGKVRKSFDGVCRSSIAKLNNSSYLLVDSDGFVMVADDGNDRVLLLDSNLGFKREILTKEHHGLKGPMKILLDESTGQLFVADNLWNYEGRILIFDCK